MNVKLNMLFWTFYFKGAGLAFVVYPEALIKMEWCPPFFSFLFFFMLVLLALSSICGALEVTIGSIYDQFLWCCI